MRVSPTLVAVGLLLACDAQSATRVDAGRHTGTAAQRDAKADVAPVHDAQPSAEPLRVGLFSRTTGYRHAESISAGRAALTAWAESTGLQLVATEDAAQLTAELDLLDVVVFLLTTGDVLNAAQQTAFEAYIRRGGGFVGVHSASDTEYDWPFYGELVGAWFDSHPAVQAARVRIAAKHHPAAAGLPDPWSRIDEWYNFRENPRSNVQVVLTVDENSYEGGTMGADHPVAWSRSIGAGRAFYTALGHEGSAWSEPLVRQHIQNAVLWAGARTGP